MSRVFTGNVFITTSKLVIEKMFNHSVISRFPDLLKVLTPEDIDRSIIASPKINTNLLEFDFSFGYTGSKVSSLRLKLLETNKPFEKQYLNRNIVKNTIEAAYSNLIGSIDVSGTQNLTSKFTKELIEDHNTIYFAFGIGDNVREWSGPFVMNQLLNAELVVTDAGNREIELNFTNLTSFFGRNIIEFGNNESFNTALNRYNFIIPNKTIVFGKSELVKNDNYFATNLKKAILKIIKNYIQDCSNGCEAIVLLPNIETLVERKLKTQFDSPQQIVKEFNIVSARTPVQPPYYVKGIPTGIRNLGDSFDLVKDIVHSVVGMDVCRSSQRKIWENIIPPNIDVAQEYQSDINVNKSIFVGKTVKVKTPNAYKETFDYIISMSISSDENTDATESIPDFYIPLKRIGDKIKDSIFFTKSEVNFDLYFSTENDLQILKLWKDIGLINSDQKQVYVFGSKELIESYLYLKNVETVEDAIADYAIDPFLDPELRYKLHSTGYKVKFLNIKSRGQNNSSFGENALQVDPLFYQTTEENIAKAKILKTPIFRHNMDNANVQSVSVKNNALYAGVYNLGMSNKNFPPLINSVNKYYADIYADFELKYPNLIEQFRKYVEPEPVNKNIDKLRILYENEIQEEEVDQPELTLDLLLDAAEKYINSQTQTQSTTIYAPGNEPDIRKLINSNEDPIKLRELLAISVLSRKNGKNKPYVEYSNEQEAAAIETDLFENLNKLAFQVDIKTLPFFKISGISDIAFKKATLISMYNSIIGYENVKRPAYFSGEYRLKCFRHFISASDMYSEFSLIGRDYEQQLNNEKNK